MFDATERFQANRLPELFAGLPRDEGSFPVQYLGASVPQAWAAASIFRLVAVLCGIHAPHDPTGSRLYVDPALPDWLPELTIRNLRAGSGAAPGPALQGRQRGRAAQQHGLPRRAGTRAATGPATARQAPQTARNAGSLNQTAYHARIQVRPEAAALYERLFGNKDRDAAVADRIPPGQYRTEKFPVLHYGSVPKIDLATWDFKVYGQVDSPLTLTWDQFKALPRKTVETDIHCVTRWTKLDTTWEGVPIQHVLELAQLRPEVSHVVAHSEQGYTANVPLAVLDDDDVLLADTFDGQPLEPEHGYPLRLVVPKRYFWKSAKWIRGLEFLDHDQLGFWERYGYNNDADPWKEERYSE